MTNVSVMRLAAAGLIAGAAGLAGLLIAPRAAPPPAPAPSSVTAGPAPVLQSDISELSLRLRATGLFPAAISLHAAQHDSGSGDRAAGGTADAAEAAAAGAVAPVITALVREDRVWRVHAGGVITERARLTEGDELYDGWHVEEIGATHVLLRRGDETRAIHFFEPRENG